MDDYLKHLNLHYKISRAVDSPKIDEQQLLRDKEGFELKSGTAIAIMQSEAYQRLAERESQLREFYNITAAEWLKTVNQNLYIMHTEPIEDLRPEHCRPENWASEGLCPKCGESGKYIKLAPVCSTHGPY